MNYNEMEGLRSTDLKLFLENPYMYKRRNSFGLESNSLSFGNLVHTLVLEPDTYENRYRVAPTAAKNTKAGKEIHAAFAESLEGLSVEVISQEDFNKASKMADNVKVVIQDAFGFDIAVNPTNEVEYSAKADNGLDLKAKFDCLYKDSILDVKTTKEMSSKYLKKVIYDYRYDVSAAHYLNVGHKNNLQIKNFFLVFVSSINSRVWIVKLSEETLKSANDLCLKAYNQIKIFEDFDELSESPYMEV